MSPKVYADEGGRKKNKRTADTLKDPVGLRWWLEADPARAAGSIFAWLDQQRTRTSQANLTDLLYEAMYTGRPIGDEDNAMAPTRGMVANGSGSPAYMNVIESIIDTLTAKLGKRRPMPVVSADDASHGERLFAKGASRIIRRKMGGGKLERMFPTCITDMCVRGTAAVHVHSYNGDVHAERIPRHECIVDRREARYGEPRTMVRLRSQSAELLAEKYPDHKDAIMRTARDRADEWHPYEYDAPSNSDMVQVAEGWHLPTPQRAGIHVITIRGLELFREPWTRQSFPVVFARYKTTPRGFWGKSLVEILMGMQAFINSEFKDIQEAFYWASALITFVPRGSNIVQHHLRARQPAIVEYDGQIPTYEAPQVVSPQRLQFFADLVNRMYEMAGVSQLSASSKNPLGSNASGKAIDTMYDIESDRFSDLELEYEWLRVETGRQMLCEARELVAKNEADEDGCELASWITEVGSATDWAKFDIDGGKYHLVAEAENFVPDSRAGRLSTIAELGKSGLITDPAKLLAGMEEPDLARLFRTQLAPYNAICAIVERVGNTSKDLPPVDPQFAPYDALLDEVKAEHFDAISTGADEETLQRFRDFQQLVIAEQTKVQAAMAPPPGMGAPPGALSAPGQAPPLPVGTSAIPLPGGPNGMPLMPQGIA